MLPGSLMVGKGDVVLPAKGLAKCSQHFDATSCNIVA